MQFDEFTHFDFYGIIHLKGRDTIMYNYDGAGIYRLTIGESIYIGSSANVSHRIKSHISAARRGKEPKRIQEAYNAHGSMSADVLEKVQPETTKYDLLKLEQKWIDKLQPDLNGCPVRESDPVDNLVRFMKREQLAKSKASTEEHPFYRARYEREAERLTATIEDQKEMYFSPVGGAPKVASNQEAVKKYQANRDAIMLRPSKEDGKEIREAAARAGQSVQAYILQAVRDRMQNEN